MRRQTLLTYNDVIDCTRSYKQILGIDKNPEDFVPYHIRRFINFVNTDLAYPLTSENIDMATLLMILRYRHCDISIPKYTSTTVAKTRKTEIISGEDRHGEILSLKSNENTFKFSVMIADKSYHEKKLDGTETDFCPRTYSITDDNGNFHNNWNSFKFNITLKEEDYFSNILNYGSKIYCKNFVNLPLAQAFYTEYYRNMKVFDERLGYERMYINSVKSEYIKKCKVLSNDEFKSLDGKAKVIKESAEQFESVKVLCFESKITNVPENYDFNYIKTNKRTPEEIVAECDELLEGLTSVRSEFRFLCRLIEFAFFKVNPYSENMDPSKFTTYNRNDCKWNEQKVRLPRGRIDWFELMCKDYSILCRYYFKSVKQRLEEET